MAGQVLKKRRLVNPARRRRRLSNKQIKYFGTKRQKAGLRNRGGRNRAGSHRRRRNQTGFVSQAEHAAADAIHTVERAAEDAIHDVTHAVNRGRRRNVGEILTVIPANPGRKRRKNKMAATHRRRKNRRRNRGAVANRRRNRRRNTHRTHNRSYGHRPRTRNRNPKVVVRYRNRRHNRRHNAHRRRNQGMNFLQGDAGAVVGVLGGAAVTKIITGFLPSNLTTGWPGYITTSIVAVVTGQVGGKLLKNSRLGTMMTVGGLVMVGLQVLADFFPQLQLPFTVSGTTAAGTSGMGLITSSNFFVPQVNLPGSMASFVAPAAIPAPVVVPATAMSGFGATGTSTMNSGLRRVGRLR